MTEEIADKLEFMKQWAMRVEPTGNWVFSIRGGVGTDTVIYTYKCRHKDKKYVMKHNSSEHGYELKIYERNADDPNIFDLADTKHNMRFVQVIPQMQWLKVDCIEERFLAWANETFPQANINSVLHHLRKEIDEYFDPDADKYEIADCAQLILHAREKIKADKDIMKLVDEKLDINIRRKWLPPDEHGVSYHVKDNQSESKTDQEGRNSSQESSL